MQKKLVILKAMKTFTVLQTIHICFICIDEWNAPQSCYNPEDIHNTFITDFFPYQSNEGRKT